MAPFAKVDDVGFARALVQVIAAEANIDLQRVYATGLSTGGAMSHRLACEAADVFAAVAPVAFPLAFAPLSNCQPSRPIAVLHFAGLTDGIVPYEGGELFPGLPPIPSAQESFTYWREVNGCGDGPLRRRRRRTAGAKWATSRAWEACRRADGDGVLSMAL